jgi:4a-hydroxytetrahydrobiopterin dehydratase
METPLVDRPCVPTGRGTPPLTAGRVAPLLAQLEGWEIEDAGGHQQIVKTFRVPDFVGAVDLVNRLTPVAEAEAHHPDLLVSWGRLRVQLWTHAAGGLTENDFILAAKIDRVATGR